MCFLKHFPLDLHVLKEYEHEARIKHARVADVLKTNDIEAIPDGDSIVATVVPVGFFMNVKPGIHIVNGKELLLDAVMKGKTVIQYYQVPFTSIVPHLDLTADQIRAIKTVSKDQIPLMLSGNKVTSPRVLSCRNFFNL